MSLQARRIGETQAQYRRRVGTKRPQTVNPGLNRQKVERVSVMPQDMKSKDVAIPNQEVRIKRKPQQTGVGVAIPEKKTDRGRPVTKIGNRTIYEADMREAKANQQNLAEAQRRQLQVAEAKEVKGLPSKRITVEQQLKNLERQAKLFQNRKNVPPEIVKNINAQIQKLKKVQEGAKPRPLQQAEFRIIEKLVDPRTGKPFTPQQLKQIRANNERFAKEQATKQPLLQKFMKGEIGRRELRGTFTPQEIRNIQKGRLARQFLDGKLTDRQLSRSGKFSVRELREIKRNARYNRMSPEEKRAFRERQLKSRQRLDKMAEDRRTQPQRRRRRIRDAFRRMREERRSRRGIRGRTTLEKPTRGTAPVRYRRAASGVRVGRRGMRGPR